ncbi:hypothetical protein QO004_006073 [Rhizobium mesoamericanum]|nr:hypothetical protein [Rhizobium mesoamericanum]
MYLFDVTRLTVDSCMLIASAMVLRLRTKMGDAVFQKNILVAAISVAT